MTRFIAFFFIAGSLMFASPLVWAQPEPDQWYRIKNVRSKKVLAIGEDKDDQIVQRIGGPNPRQQWKFVPVPVAQKHYYITTVRLEVK